LGYVLIANKAGWYWYQAIETQALLIEAFTEVSNDHKSVDDKSLVIKKQTN
jgi:hypothetical protein